MEIIVNAVVLNGYEIDQFRIKVNNSNYLKVRRRLELERKKILSKLRDFKKAGLIRSIKRPKNKEMKEKLINLVDAKKEIKNSLSQMISIFK